MDLGRGCGQVLSALTFYLDDQSSNLDNLRDIRV